MIFSSGINLSDCCLLMYCFKNVWTKTFSVFVLTLSLPAGVGCSVLPSWVSTCGTAQRRWPVCCLTEEGTNMPQRMQNVLHTQESTSEQPLLTAHWPAVHLFMHTFLSFHFLSFYTSGDRIWSQIYFSGSFRYIPCTKVKEICTANRISIYLKKADKWESSRDPSALGPVG